TEEAAGAKDEGVQFDMAPTCNFQPKAGRRLQGQPLPRWFKQGLQVNISTGSRTVSRTPLAAEYLTVAHVLGCTRQEIWVMNLQALDGGFGEPAVRAKLRDQWVGEVEAAPAGS